MSDTPNFCPICGTENNAHHSAACVDIREKAIDKCNELERENAELKESRDNWQKKAETVENLLMTIQAWDLDKHALRGHQCLAKQWICSLQDRIYRYKRGKK